METVTAAVPSTPPPSSPPRSDGGVLDGRADVLPSAAPVDATAAAASLGADELLDAFRARLAGGDLYELREFETKVNELLVATRAALRRKEDEAEEERQCSVCLSRRKQIVLNCGHQFCGSCSEGLLLCAMCRTPITHRIKLF